MNKKEDFNNIIKCQRIKSVFQSIVSLKDGTVHGYEALSRIKNPEVIHSPEELFRLAHIYGKTWELEKLCRKQILRSYSIKYKENYNGKLFINVNPMVMMDKAFQSNFTKRYLQKMGVSPESIVIEITERNEIEDIDRFVQVLKHYKNEGYQIAIDDLGACYSGLNIICSIHPQYLKIDMELIRNIHKDSMKYAIVKGLVEIARQSAIYLIAEGIESEEELAALIELGVDFGQGFFLGKPNAELTDISYNAKIQIENYNSESNQGWNETEYRLLSVTIDDYKALDMYSEKYGDEKADALVNCLFGVVERCVRSTETMHIMNDCECVVAVERTRQEFVTEKVIQGFRDLMPCFYDKVDLNRGYIDKITKKGKIKKAPLCDVRVERIK